MERYTKKDVQIQFERLCCLFGKRIAKSYNDVGAWRLDHVACYGGYNIEEINNTSGGISHPFNAWGKRKQARAFIEWAFEITEAVAEYTGAYRNGTPLYKIPLSTLPRYQTDAPSSNSSKDSKEAPQN